MLSAVDYKLRVKESDSNWTVVAKRIINSLIDYAKSVNKFRTIRIGEWAERDSLPGFFIIFPALDAQDQAQFTRTEHAFNFECAYTCKGKDYRNALEELLELHGALIKAIALDRTTQTTPTIGVPEVNDIAVAGLVTGTATGTTQQSFEYLYGRTIITVSAIINLRG